MGVKSFMTLFLILYIDTIMRTSSMIPEVHFRMKLAISWYATMWYTPTLRLITFAMFDTPDDITKLQVSDFSW